jgi:hypothetical protein
MQRTASSIDRASQWAKVKGRKEVLANSEDSLGEKDPDRY